MPDVKNICFSSRHSNQQTLRQWLLLQLWALSTPVKKALLSTCDRLFIMKDIRSYNSTALCGAPIGLSRKIILNYFIPNLICLFSFLVEILINLLNWFSNFLIFVPLMSISFFLYHLEVSSIREILMIPQSPILKLVQVASMFWQPEELN